MSTNHAALLKREEAPKAPRPVVPDSRIGWWAIGLAATAGVGWIVLPVIGALVGGDRYPAVSSATMVAAMLLVIAAAVFNALSVSLWKQRSVLNIVMAVLTIPNAVIVVAEVISIVLGGD